MGEEVHVSKETKSQTLGLTDQWIPCERTPSRSAAAEVVVQSNPVVGRVF